MRPFHGHSCNSNYNVTNDSETYNNKIISLSFYKDKTITNKDMMLISWSMCCLIHTKIITIVLCHLKDSMLGSCKSKLV